MYTPVIDRQSNYLIDILSFQQWNVLIIGSRKIPPEENCPLALILTLFVNQTLTLTGGQFSSGVIFRTLSLFK